MKALIGIVLAALIGLNIYQHIDRTNLKNDLALAESAIEARTEEVAEPLRKKTETLTKENAALVAKVATLEEAAKEAETVAAGEDTASGGGKENPIKAIAKAMDNPAMKELMVAQQKATIDTMYKRLYEKLQLEGEDLEHFQGLLTDAQMTMVELGMKMMGGEISEEERKELVQKIQDSQKQLKENVKEFLNDDDDFDYYEFYTDTLSERMAMSGLQQALTQKDIALAPAKEEELVKLMHEERQAIQFEDHYYDQNRFDPSTMNKAKVDRFLEQYTQLETNVANRAGSILNQEQLAVFKENQKSARAMQEMGLNMALSMFGGSEGAPE